MILGMDVSHWEEKVDWLLLKSVGVEFVFIKASQGNYLRDPMLKSHVAGASAAGLMVGAYHWCDPNIDARAQAEYSLQQIEGLPICFLAADVEQHWQDWQEWRQGHITKQVPPVQISRNAQEIANYWKSKAKLPVIIYTRASFVNTYAAPAQAWLPNFPLWVAHYPYQPTRIQTTWDDFKAKHLPGIQSPALPTGCHDWQFWQFTGDKFYLPGVSGAIDLNFFNGNLKDLQEFAGCASQPTNLSALPLTERLLRLESEARLHGWSI